MGTFIDIPDEILLEIFSHLDGESLRQSSTVCKSWNHLIGSSSRTMKKFRLKLRHDRKFRWTEKTDEIVKLKRKFQHLEIHLDGDENIESLMKIVKFRGAFVRTFKASSGSFENTKDLIEILNHLPLTESLTFTLIDVAINEAKFQQVTMKYLKHIELNFTNWEILKYFPASQITSLKVIQGLQKQTASLIAFLLIATNLDTLELERDPFEEVFLCDQSRNFPFKLRKLKITTFLKASDEKVNGNFQSFLTTQEFLQELDLRHHSSNEVIATIFMHLKGLKTLKIYANSLPSTKDFYFYLQRLDGLKYLEIYGQSPNAVAVKGILSSCPNIEVLVAMNDPVTPLLLPFIAKSLRIKSLHIDLSLIFEND